MAYFLAGVADAEIFKNNESFATAKTLIDSSITIGVSAEDIRAGQGAPIQFSFYHDPSVEITLTDIQFKKEYITAQLGAEFDKSPESYQTFDLSLTAGTAKVLDVQPLKMPIPCGEDYIVWASKKGSDEYFNLEISGSEGSISVTLPEGYESGDYCVRYLAEDTRAKVAEITASIIPSELFLIITAPIFAGDACAASRGKAAGHITFEVPRFLLNGGQEFAMNMSSNQNMNLAGIALASESSSCESNGGKLLRIIEVVDDRKWYDEVVDLVADPDYITVGEAPEIYGLTKNHKVVKALLSDLTFTPALTAGKWTSAAKTTFKATEKPEIEGSAVIESAE